VKDGGFASCLGLIVAGVAVSVVSVVLDAWALKTLWGWFVVSAFGLPALGLAQAMGLSCIASFVVARGTFSTKKEESYGWGKAIAYAVVHPVFSVILGWIILQVA
jgi:hypothetical protein